MKRLAFPLIFILGAVILVLMSGTFFTVQQTESALILQFGRVVTEYRTPGLKVKMPFMQEVLYFDNRLLHFSLPELEVNAADQKRLVVDLFVRYRIVDVLRFYKTIGQDIRNVENRLSGLVLDNMQEVIARFPLSAMLSPKRSEIMDEIHKRVMLTAKSFGIEVKDVRIIRGDLPPENGEAIFNRMESERNQEAKQFRAEGEELAQGVVAQADRDRTVILAEAREKAEVARGEGEGVATDIYGKAYGQDKKFYELWRSWQGYRTAFTPKDTTVILSSDTDFLKHFSGTKK
jgi:membrane protease subunit HflC